MHEFSVLEHIYRANAALGPRVSIPPGDDMGMIALSNGGLVLSAVDQLVAGRHVDMAVTPLALVGRKAIARCLSDVAAMAAVPAATLVAAALPPKFGDSRAIELFDAMRETAQQFEAPLIGGYIATLPHASDPLVLGVTLLAEPISPDLPPVTRGVAMPGDTIYVTGSLGGTLEPGGLGRHLTFEPRVREAIELRKVLKDRLHSMIDVSDGLGRDCSHIASLSGVRLELNAAAIPCRHDLPWLEAVRGGEDYELCFTAVGHVPSTIHGTLITAIGRVIGADASTLPPTRERRHDAHDPASWLVIFRDGDTLHPGDDLGWQHQS